MCMYDAAKAMGGKLALYYRNLGCVVIELSATQTSSSIITISLARV